jgi:Raf kinase inhibitor-like YbhB/YbcL family protein
MALELMSNAFNQDSEIPTVYTCDGNNGSPPLSWRNVPENTQSLVLIVDDPDAPRGVFSHWVVFNIPPDVSEFTANTSDFGNGAVQGRNDFGDNRYGGPCPPLGPAHRYYFRLFALDTRLDLAPHATRDVVLDAIENNIIETAEFFGRYARRTNNEP